jgi:hypothetical protein
MDREMLDSLTCSFTNVNPNIISIRMKFCIMGEMENLSPHILGIISVYLFLN